jgi:NitT/TauT family transport system substrate-binding protein
LAQKRGFLKEEGIEAEIVTISGPVANIALASGEIDYFTGFGSAMRAMIQGQLPARIVVCYRPLPHFVVVARPEIKSIKDLKGKTFGSSPGGGPDLVARLIIKHFGMDPDKDIKFTRSTNDIALARMKQGLMDATVLPVPRDYQAIKMGFRVLARAEDLFTYPISGLVAHTKKIKEKPDEIKRVIRAGINANRYMRANRDGTIPILMSTYRLDKEVARHSMILSLRGLMMTETCQRTASGGLSTIRKASHRYVARWPLMKSQISRFSKRRNGSLGSR